MLGKEWTRGHYRRFLLAAAIVWIALSLGLALYANVLRPGAYDGAIRTASLVLGLAFSAVGVGLAYAAVAGEFVEEDGTTKLVVGGVKLKF